MTDAKHRAQEAAGEVWPVMTAVIERAKNPNERDAIVFWLEEFGNHDPDQYGICRRCDAAARIRAGDHLKGDVA